LHAGKLEFFALKWAVTEQFRDYLCYAPEFTVYTDNNPPMNILTSAKLSVTTLQWVGELADYRFPVKYRPGKSNVDADTLLRMPLNIEDYTKTCCKESSSEVVQAAVCSMQFQSQEDLPQLTALTDSLTAVDNYDSVQGVEQNVDLCEAQGRDPVISRVVYFMKTGTRPSVKESKVESRGVHRFLRQVTPLVASRPQRFRRAPVRMTYDVPGQPAYYPVVTTNLHTALVAPNPVPAWFGMTLQYQPVWYWPRCAVPFQPT